MAGHGYRGSLRLRIGEKAAPYVAPWLLALAAFPVAVAIHFTVGGDGRWMAVLGVVFTAMTYGTWQTWRGRKHESRVVATLFTGLGLGWVAFAGTGTPWAGDMLKAWVIGGVSLSSFWMIKHAGVTGGHERDRAGDGGTGSWLGDKISAFKNSKVAKGDVTVTADELRVRHHLDVPTTAGDAQRTVDQIAAVAGVDKNQVKVLKVKGDEGQVDVVLNKATDTSRPVKYAGPSAPGQSCAAAPLYLGRRTDGSDIEWWMPGDTNPDKPRNVVHCKCTGTTGAGKTETICTAILDMRWRTDIVPVVGDPAKFQQGFGDIAECLGLAAKTKDQVLQLLDNLAGPVIEYRSDLLGSLERSDGGTGYKQWEPECYTLHGVPFIFVDIEEAADVIMDRDQEVYEAARKLRSLGIKLCLSTQTMPHDDIPRKARGLFGESLAHGQKEYQDAKYALSSETLEANADPTKWGADSPGSLYAEVTGTDKVHWAIDGRAVYMGSAEKQFSIEGSRQFWASMDPGTYARLAYCIDPMLSPAEEDADLDEYEDEEDEMGGGAAFEGVSGVDPNVPLTPPRPGLGIDFTDGETGAPVRLTTEEARRRLSHRLEVMARGGHVDITIDDLADIPNEVGRTPGWVYEQLNLLEEAGVLRSFKPPKGKKIYTIIRQFPDAQSASGA
jgi:hypothetical protein